MHAIRSVRRSPSSLLPGWIRASINSYLKQPADERILLGLSRTQHQHTPLVHTHSTQFIDRHRQSFHTCRVSRSASAAYRGVPGRRHHLAPLRDRLLHKGTGGDQQRLQVHARGDRYLARIVIHGLLWVSHRTVEARGLHCCLA